MAAGNGISREVQLSMAVSSMFLGFRFSPTDEELISFYLKKKLEGYEKSVEIIAEVEIYKYEPWDLPAKSIIQSVNEWFFFSPRGKKYPNGNQTRRATNLGYWKATGKERNVKSGSNAVGTKRTLVFHTGRAPKGERTEWIMHEYNTKDKAQVNHWSFQQGTFELVSSMHSWYESICFEKARGDPFWPRIDVEPSGSVSIFEHKTRQDFLVVCRLRRNSKFRQHSSSNPGSSCRKHLSSLQTHSGEQVDSTSESNQKDAAEAAVVVESSGDQKDYGSDDFYTEILNDDIINLDESAPPKLFPLVFHRTDIEKKSQHDAFGVLEWLPNQGSANRRIRLKKRESFAAKKLDAVKIGGSKYMVEKGRFPCLELWRSRLMNSVSSVSIVRVYVRVVVFGLLILLALFVSQLKVFDMSKGQY